MAEDIYDHIHGIVPSDLLKLERENERLRKRIKRLNERLGYFESAIEDAARAIADRGKGGMQVPFHGDFASAVPSVISRLRWWARDLRDALGGDEK